MRIGIMKGMQETEWRKIPKAEIYEVSNTGMVRRSPAAPKAVNTYPGRILNPDYSTGYARVSLRMNGKLFRELVHRLVARAFLENARAFAHVNHKDGNKRNNNLRNLEWCSPQQNVRHAWDAKLCAPRLGEASGQAKLKEHDILAIRDARERGVPLGMLAKVFGVTEANISTIDRNLTWKHI